MQTMQRFGASAIDPTRPGELDQCGLTYNVATTYAEKIDSAGPELLPETVREQLKQFWRDCLYEEKEAVTLLIHGVQAAIDPSSSEEPMEEQITRGRATCTKMVTAIIEFQINATVEYVRGLPEHERTPAVHYSAHLSKHVQDFLKLTMEAVGTAAEEVFASPPMNLRAVDVWLAKELGTAAAAKVFDSSRTMGAVDVQLAKAVESAYDGAWSKLM